MRRLLTIAAFLPCVACGAGPATTPLAPTDGDSDSNTTSDNTVRPTHSASELAKIRSFKSSVSGQTSSQAASCNGETYAGHCEDDDVIWCDNGQVIEAHCASAGEVCAWSDADSFYGCVAPSPTGCNGVTYNGNCNGSTAEWCANNALFDLACGDYGGVCQVDSSGLANCTYPAQLGYMPDFDWHESLPIVSMSQDIGAIGGTELRSLVAFDGKLFAANGYWVDSEQSNPGLPGAQILRLDSPGAQWQIDYELDETIANGRRRFYTFASLHRVVMNMDDTGTALPASVPLLLASTWSSEPGLFVFSRTTGAANWRKTRLANTPAVAGTQLRSFIAHRDRVTGQEVVVAGATNAIYEGMYNVAANDIVWSETPEWTGNFTAVKNSQIRILSMVECNGKLYASTNAYVLERQDGPTPTWNLVAQVTLNDAVAEGLRGLTAIANPSGSGEVLLTAAEDSPARVYMIDPSQMDASGQFYKTTIDLNISAFMSRTLATQVTYGIAAYNHMAVLDDPSGTCPSLLLGVHLTTPNLTDVYGAPQRTLDPRAYFLIRDCYGNYNAREIRDYSISPVPILEATRTLLASPFAADPSGTVYAGGFDAADMPIHNSAWLYRGVPIVD
jgi:hypothetical protein